MKHVLTIVVLLVLPTTPLHADPGKSQKGVEILKMAQKAASRLKSVSYEAKFWGEGAGDRQALMVQGKVVARRGADYARHRVFIEGSLKSPRASQPSTFRFASDGENISKITEDPKVYATGKASGARTVERSWLFPPMFMGDSAFKNELNGALIEYEGDKKVEGVDCHVVKVAYDDAGSRLVKFYFGKSDHLLRRTERPISINARGRQQEQASMSSLVYSVKDLKINPDVDDSMFRLEYPEGYVRQDIRQPVRRQSSRYDRVAVGDEAPDWTLKNDKGSDISLKSLRGKIVLLDFWSTWCSPCRRAMPGLEKLHKKYKDKPVAIYGVNCREKSPKADPIGYIKEKGYTYGQLLGGNSVANEYGVTGIPAFFIIDKDGKLLHIGRGFNPHMDAEMGRIIDEALK